MSSLTATDPSASSSLRVVELDDGDDRRWDDFVIAHPDGMVYHHSKWIESLENEHGQHCLRLACEDSEGRLRAILPLLVTKGLPIRAGRVSTSRRLSSLPRTPLAGPLALDPESLRLIVRHSLEMVRARRNVRLELKTEIEGLAELVPELVRVTWRPTFVEELPPHVEGACWEEFCENLRLPRNCGSCGECRRLRFGNAKRQHRVNWAVNKAIKSGLEVREARTLRDLRKWYQLYLQTMRHNAIPPRSYDFFSTLWSKLHSGGQLRLFLAEQRTGSTARLVAGSITLSLGQTVYYAFTGCSHYDFCLHPHDILQIESIRSACKNGFRWYDFGEVAEDHESLSQFKSKWGTESRPLYRYYYPEPDKHTGSKTSLVTDWSRYIWRRLPLSITALLGQAIYRYL